VYSMAILLEEEGLLTRTQIYATDLSEASLEKAKKGQYSSVRFKEFEKNYSFSGGKRSIAEYFVSGHHVNGPSHFIIRENFQKNITWAQHNLATDSSFNEFDLILCRNVLFYFNQHLQDRVYTLFLQSLTEDGLLVLGNHETLHLTPGEANYYALDRRQKIYLRQSEIA